MRLKFEQDVEVTPTFQHESADETRSNSSDRFDTLLADGISAARSGDRNTARELLTQASELNSRSEDAFMWLASISDYPEELLAFLDHVLEINAVNARAIEWRAATISLLAKTLVQRAVTSHEEGSFDLAEQCLDQAIALDPHCEMAWFWKASMSHNVEQKIVLLEQVLVINDGNADARELLAAVKQSGADTVFAEAKAAAVADEREQAADLLDKLLVDDPQNTDAWILRSHVALRFDDKLSFFKKAVDSDPDSMVARSAFDFLSAISDSTIVAEQTIEAAYETGVSTLADEEAGSKHDDETITDQADMQMAVLVGDEVEIDPGSQSDEVQPLDDMDSSIETFIEEETEMADTVDQFLEPEMSDDPIDSPVVYETAEEVSEETEYSLPYISEDSEVADEPAMQSQDVEEYSFEPVPFDSTVVPSNSSLFDEHPNMVDMTDNVIDLGSADQHVTLDPVFEDDVDNSMESQAGTPVANGVSCVYCDGTNDPQTFECNTCHATLSLSDIESVLSNPRVDREILQQAITRMEAEWNFRDFSENELTALGVGHFHLKNYADGYKYLQEASRLNPNNVILSGQINALAIRMDEMSRQNNDHPSHLEGKTILVVDDSATIRKLISGKLEKSGHTVVCASDGVEALALIEENVPDLVLLDITMPRMDGYEVCKNIRSNPVAKDLPVVMISGKDGFFDKVRGRMAGTTGYVTKPFGPETLMKALETYLVASQSDSN